jgi:hypothetical protein
MIGQFYRARGYVLETFNLKLAGDKNFLLAIVFRAGMEPVHPPSI